MAWNLIGGFDWQGIEWAARHLGVTDYDELVTDLIMIRDAQHG